MPESRKHDQAVASFNSVVSQGAAAGSAQTAESRLADWPVPCELTTLAESELGA